MVQLGSYTKAAKELGVFQSTITRRMIKLEDKLGVKLLSRSCKQFELTKYGIQVFQVLVNEEQQILNKINSALSHEDILIGNLKIALPTSISLKVITPKLSKFLVSYPQLKVRILYQNQELNIRRSDVDIAVTYEMPEAHSQKVKSLYRVLPVAYCSPEYINKYGKINSIKDMTLHQHRIINVLRDQGEIINRIDMQHEITGEVVAFKTEGNLAVNNAMHAMALVDSGEFITISYRECLDEYFMAGKYVRVLPEYTFNPFSFYLVKRVEDDKRINIFAKFIEDCFRGYPDTINLKAHSDIVSPHNDYYDYSLSREGYN